MYRLFNSIREDSLKTRKILRYLGYAIGEIALVVIGILIAIQLDDLNEARKQREDFLVALHQVGNDLRNDIQRVDELIDRCEATDSMAALVMENRATAEMYTANGSRLSILVTVFQDMRIHQNGYNLVQKVLEYVPGEFDTLISNLAHLYIEEAPRVLVMSEEIRAFSFNTMSLWRDNYEWFSSSAGLSHPSAVKYFLEDWTYRNRVQYRRMLGIGYKEELHKYREASLNTLWLMRQLEGANTATLKSELSEVLEVDTIAIAPCPEKELRDKDFEEGIYSVFLFHNMKSEGVFLYNSDNSPLSNIQYDRYHQQDGYIEPGELAFVTDLASNEVYIKNKKGECLGAYTTGRQNGIVSIK